MLEKNEDYVPDLGAIIGMVDIVDSVPKSRSDFFHGPHGWVLANPVNFRKPTPFKGAVGIFYVPRSLLKGTPAAKASPGSTSSS